MPADHTTLDRIAATPEGQGAGSLGIRKELSEVISRAKRSHRVYYVLVEIAAPAYGPLDLLHQSATVPVVYWSGRNSLTEYAGVGAKAQIRFSGPDALRRATTEAAGLLDRCVTITSGHDPFAPRLFAGFAFEHSTSMDAIWAGYDDAVLILPELMVVQGAQGARAYLTLEVQPQSNLDDLLRVLDTRLAGLSPKTIVRKEPPLPGITFPEDERERDEWMRAVDKALAQMREGTLEKVVLARRIVLRATGTIPVWPLMRRLHAAATGCFHFAFGMPGGQVFVGASPERLFRLQGREIETDCLAGTTERGADTPADDTLADALLASAKDRLEHYYVLEDSLRRLGDLCTAMNADTRPRVIKLSTLQHLATTVRGQLNDGVGVGDILEQMHPTPAVGGTPRETALTAIRSLEPQSRGWYAGPVGWIERGRAEFAVAIRSALLSGDKAYVYAGAGIVPGSEPTKEWQETQKKAEAFLKAVWG